MELHVSYVGIVSSIWMVNSEHKDEQDANHTDFSTISFANIIV